MTNAYSDLPSPPVLRAYLQHLADELEGEELRPEPALQEAFEVEVLEQAPGATQDRLEAYLVEIGVARWVPTGPIMELGNPSSLGQNRQLLVDRGRILEYLAGASGA